MILDPTYSPGRFLYSFYTEDDLDGLWLNDYFTDDFGNSVISEPDDTEDGQWRIWSREAWGERTHYLGYAGGRFMGLREWLDTPGPILEYDDSLFIE